MKLFSTEVEEQIKKIGWDIVDLKDNDRAPKLDGCNWWILLYNFHRFSIYFDPDDILGSVGEPYYELYDGEETYRYCIDEFSDLITELKINKKIIDADVKEFPERFL